MDLMHYWMNLESGNEALHNGAVQFFRSNLRSRETQEFLHEMLVLSVMGRTRRELRARCAVLDLTLEFFTEFPLLKRCLVANLQPDTPAQVLLHLLTVDKNATAMRDEEIGGIVSNLATDSGLDVEVRKAAIAALRHGALIGRRFVHVALDSLSCECHPQLGEAFRTLDAYAAAELV